MKSIPPNFLVYRCLVPLNLALGLLLSTLHADDLDYDSQVRPILEAHCTKCHGQTQQKGELRLDTLSPDFIADRRAAERWHDVRDALNLGEMPPKSEPELTNEHRQILVTWINHQIATLLRTENITGGRVVLRRLNRDEYQNTMRDLLGIDTDYIKNLPPERLSEDGFRNNGSTLQMSDLQLEYYLEAARDGLRKAIVTRPQPQVFHQKFTKSATDKNRGSNFLNDDEQFVAKLMEYPSEGEFIIRIKARAKFAAGRGYPRMRVGIGYRADVQAPRMHIDPVDITSEDWQVYEFRDRIEHFPLPSKTQSKFPGLLVWIDNVYAEGLNKPLKPKKSKKKKKTKGNDGPAKTAEEDDLQSISVLTYPTIEIESMEFVGPAFEQWPPQHHSQILFPPKQNRQDETSYAELVIERFMQRAFRRPVSKEEVSPFLGYFQTVRDGSASFEHSIQETLSMVLISPDFLYLFEPSGESQRQLNDWELASRLSYFLWCTSPDQQLLELAETGKLHEPEVLNREVGRMIRDQRSWQFVEQFAGQWLDTGAVDRVAINPEFYPEFDDQLKASMRDETLHFFAEILSKDLSALNILDSEFAMLNEPLAKHYGLSGPRGSAFERVPIKPDDPRGGVLANASMLLGNSTGEDSHPVKRAVWIRERLLNDPPADPPPNVPNLDSNDPGFENLSVREQLQAHRKETACNDCHQAIDPWGIALENFGADGLWRDEIPRKTIKGKQTNRQKTQNSGFSGQPVVAVASLPDGTRIAGPDELKAYLLEHRSKQFAKAVTTKLLTYALGRSLELTDEHTVEQLTESFIKSDFKIEQLILEIVATESFQTK